MERRLLAGSWLPRSSPLTNRPNDRNIVSIVIELDETPADRLIHNIDRTLEGVFKDDLLTFRDIVPDLPDAPGPVHRKRSYLCPFVGICTRSLDKSPAKYNT